MRARPFGADFREPELVRAGARDDDEIDAVRQKLGPRAETLAAHALDPVSLDGVADLARGHDAEPRGRTRRLRRHEKREVLRAHAPPDRLHAQKVRPLSQAALFPEHERPSRDGSRYRRQLDDAPRLYFL